MISGIEESLNPQHKLILDMIMDGNPEGAKLAAKSHMEFVNASLTNMDKEKQRHERYMSHSSVLSDKK